MGVLVSKDLSAAAAPGYLMNTGLGPSARAGSGSIAKSPAKETQPTTPTEQQAGALEIAKWGEDNLFPQTVREEVERNTIIPAVLQKMTGAWYGGGVAYGFATGFDEAGNETLTYRRDPVVDAFMKRSRVPSFAYEGLQDLAWWGMCFPEMGRSVDGKTITYISTQDAMYCRFGRPTASGALDKLYISANWAKGVAKGIETAKQVPVLDPYFDAAEKLRGLKGDKFIYPLAVPSPGRSIYQLTSWNSVRLSGWLEVFQAIPEFKKQLFVNQLSLKYLIEVNKDYWSWKYPEWERWDGEKRRATIAAELKAFTEMMTGTAGAGKSIMTISMTDPRTGKEVSGWKVTAIDDKLKDGLYIEDSQEAASHIYTALGFPPTLMGVSPGKSMGAGSGSDARVAFNNYISTSRYYLDLITEPLELIRDYNGWSPDLRFRFRNPLIMTLDRGKQVQQETA